MDKGNTVDVEMPSDPKNKIQIKSENISMLTTNAGDIKDHQPPPVASEKTANYQCGLCQKRFYQSQELKKHMKSDHIVQKNKKQIPAGDQDQQIEFLKDDTSEDITVMPDIVDTNELENSADFFLANAKCGLCHETFDDPKDLKKHLCQFLEYAPALQKKKGKKIVDPFNPKPERKRPGPKPKIKILDCQMCGKKFCNSSNLYTHIRNIHQGEKKHHCNLCGKKFPQKIHLQRHFQKVHEGQNPNPKIESSQDDDDNDSKDFNMEPAGADNVVVKIEPSEVLAPTKSESGVASNPTLIKKEIPLNIPIGFENQKLEDIDEDLEDEKPKVKNEEPEYFEYAMDVDYYDYYVDGEQEDEDDQEYYQQEEYDLEEEEPKPKKSKKSTKKSKKSKLSDPTKTDEIDASNGQDDSAATSEKKLRPYKCEICGKDFTVKGDMKKHVLFVHEGIKYPCSECPREFPTPSKQKRHFEQVHLGKYIPEAQKCRTSSY